VFFLVVDKTRVAGTKLVVRNISIDVFFMHILHIIFIGKACIGGNNNVFFKNILTQAQLLITLFYTFKNGY